MNAVVVYPGSFDPVHTGHTALARYVAGLPEVDEVWMLPSRRNPLKASDVHASDADRLAMARIAVSRLPGVRVLDTELHLPYPSYTITTLEALGSRCPEASLSLLIGSDNWHDFHLWRRADELLARFPIIIYPRPGYPAVGLPSTARLLESAPEFPVSSTRIRNIIATGGDPSPWLAPGVADYIRRHHLYH